MVLERAAEDRIVETMYPAKITKGVADKTIQKWFSKGIKAPDLAKKAHITENYLLYLPFWRFIAQGKAVGCGYSEYHESTGNVLRNVFEELVDEEFVWTECACDTGKYGIRELWLDPGGEVPYIPGTVASMDAGGSAVDASTRGREAVHEMIRQKMVQRIETVTLDKTFLIPKVFEIVYAPVWIAHYTYEGGHFTVIVDGVRGEILGGTAPANLTARTRFMILSFAAGGLMIGTALGMLLHTGSFAVSELVQIIILLLGVALCMAAYPAFRAGKTVEASGTMKNIDRLRPSLRVPKELTDYEILTRENSILTCPVCGAEVEQPWGEVVTYCSACGKLLDVTTDGVEAIPHLVAEPNLLSRAAMEDKEPQYIPFWKFEAEIDITDYLTEGDFATGLPSIEGKRSYYICAGDVPRYLSEPWEIDLTIRNPELQAGADLDERLSIFINKKTATELAEFLYIRYEAQKPGVLQVLRYNFRVSAAEIVYIPYYKEESSFIPGV
ncbi:MAG: hypothetical protein E7Z72_05490 [Methanocorpusculum parvum]|nr:hypothetical protein [Methanocorpusculum parvum]